MTAKALAVARFEVLLALVAAGDFIMDLAGRGGREHLGLGHCKKEYSVIYRVHAYSRSR